MRRPVPVTLLALSLGAFSACDADPAAVGAGIVQISQVAINPLAVNCGTTLTNPPKNIAAPDSVMIQVRMVNTTASDVLVTDANTYATVVISSDPADVGMPAANFPSVPFSPSPALLAARIGDVPIRVALPMDPVCQSKPLFYSGSYEILLIVRMTTPSGQYATVPALMKVTWGTPAL